MTDSVIPSFRHPSQAPAASRIWLALVASVLAHLLLVAALVSSMPPQSSQPEGVVPIMARIEPLPWSAPAHALATDREEFSRPQPVKRDIEVTDDARRKPVSGAAPEARDASAPTPALLHVPDLTVYTARDLDSYPRPVAPLDLDWLAEPAAGLPPAGVRLELLINEHGIVGDVAFAESGLSNRLEAQLRAVVAAARFIPARKDGRAVRSRVLLSVSFDTRKRDD